jgi:cysteinyl-tRNA synthetase
VSLRLYNTMTRTIEPFVPGVPGEVRMYVCGVTPYDLSHVGHGRSGIVFDVIRRYLEYAGFRVTFVKNFTDVEDKIIRRANQDGVSPREIADRYIAAYRADMAALGVRAGDVEPSATAHIEPAPGKPYRMVSLIGDLVARGLAYPVDGDVYFEVARFPGYGQLSGRNPEDLLAGARVDVDERKRDPRDFALWKAAKPGEPAWPSPWGPGRPGWHIECSAMAMEHLGETLDIHGGGTDLIFPHHECEIAQSEGVTGKPFARYWLHNGLVNLGTEKMSKSLGNILTIQDLVRRHDPAALRLYLVGTHYRDPLDFAEDRIRDAAVALGRLRRISEEALRLGGAERPAGALLEPAVRAFEAAMDDDFNTPRALGVLFELKNAVNAGRSPLPEGAATLVRLGEILGLDLAPETPEGSAEWAATVDRLVRQREEARKARDWGRADAIRAEIEATGAIVEDTPKGPRWKPRTAPTSR